MSVQRISAGEQLFGREDSELEGASSLLMIADRWSGSRSFLLAAARLRGLHLDSLRRGAAREGS